MDLGFETVGNATLVCYDKEPLLVTDPWVQGEAYFGSWGLSHEIPLDSLQSISTCKYVWISHGHPDHLSSRSLLSLSDKKFLVPDHVGGRIYSGLRERGFAVTILKDRKWYPLSDRIRVLSIADYNQDAILLVDIGGVLVVNMNDASDLGWGSFVKRTISQYKLSFLLKLTGFGDADMMNIWREDGTFVEPEAAKKFPVGPQITRLTDEWKTKYFIPFSSMHLYQRTDSIWALKYKTELSDYSVGFDSPTSDLLPAFVRYHVGTGVLERLNPAEKSREPIDPKEFGDDWSEPLEQLDQIKLTEYFKAFSHLPKFLDFLRFYVGGKEHIIEFRKRGFRRGFTFESPRASLMTAVDNEIFDDMLIGNFMRTIIHGNLNDRPLYPHFSPYVAKYGDNGFARSKTELRAYFRSYRKRDTFGYLRREIEQRAMNLTIRSLDRNSMLYQIVRWAYWQSKT